jgi:hypothetical protein
MARNGAKVGPKIAAPISVSPMTSMNIELMMSAALAARSWVAK